MSCQHNATHIIASMDGYLEEICTNCGEIIEEPWDDE